MYMYTWAYIPICIHLAITQEKTQKRVERAPNIFSLHNLNPQAHDSCISMIWSVTITCQIVLFYSFWKKEKNI